jgi:hypothetical protein
MNTFFTCTIVVFFTFFVWITFWADGVKTENLSQCEAAGGVAIAGPQELFDVCLDASAVIMIDK